jgi:hypothetical protein
MSMYGPSDPPAWGRPPPPPGQPGYDELGYATEGTGYAEPGYVPPDPRYREAQPPYDGMEAPYGTLDPPYDEMDEMDEADPEEMDEEDLDAPPEPNGGIAAAIIAAGIACAVLGLLVIGASASGLISQWLNFYEPTGPLSGKAIVSVVVYLVVWPNLHFRLRDKQVDLYKAFMITVALVAVGVLGTFPPVYQFFGR